jgi:DNA-binding NarL/FixJ family response regulator
MEALVISNQALTVFGVRSVLCAVEPSMVVCDATRMVQAMGLLAAEHDFRVIVLDLELNDGRPLMNAALLRDMWPDIPLVVMAPKGGDPMMERALELGVREYLHKREDTDVLRAAFGRVLAGGVNAYSPLSR